MIDKFISIEAIAKRYPGASGGEVAVFENLWLSMGRGEFGCVIGHSGCGKTTTMKILTGYLQPTDGTAKVGGIDVVEDPIAVQRMIGYLPENAPLYLDMSVQDYLNMVADLREIPEHQRRGLISEAVRDALGEACGDAVSLGEVEIRGYERPMAVWRLG